MNQPMGTKTHYKMYKSGKTWVAAGLVSGCLALGGVTAQADEQPATVADATAVVAQSTATTQPSASADTEPADANSTAAVVPDTPAVEDTTTPTSPAADVPVVDEPTVAPSEPESPELTAPVPEAPAVDVPVAPVPVPGQINNEDSVESGEQPINEPSATTETAAMPDTSATTVSTTRPVEAVVRPVQPAESSAMGASHTVAAAALVQAEMTKPAAMTVTPTATTIDDWMPNKVLQQAILLHLQRLTGVNKTWHSVADITQEDLQLLKKLIVLGNDGFDTYIDGHTAFSLEGLQYATNLETIMMEASLDHKPGAFFGDIVDVSPLANLQHLTAVHLQHNRIEDVTPLVNLQNVTEMALAFNHIHDFSPLKGKPYETFTHTGQFIVLDPLLVNDADREGHLQIQCVTITGEVVTLTAGMAVAEPVFYTDEAGHTYHIYYTGGNPKPDGQGGIYYTNIQNQKPGATEFPGAPNVDVLPDYYYLTGTYKPSAGVVDFAVVQPYVISQAASNVTVHYQDQDGNAIADDMVLAPGLVGEHYATTAPEIPGYVLTTTPENATGTYSDAAIDVTYVYALVEDGDGDSGSIENPGDDSDGNTDGGTDTGNDGNTDGGTDTGDNGNADGDADTGDNGNTGDGTDTDGNGNTDGNPDTDGNGHPGENPDGGHPGETPDGEQPGTANPDDNGAGGSDGDNGVTPETPDGSHPGTTQPGSPVGDDADSETGTAGDAVSTAPGSTGTGSGTVTLGMGQSTQTTAQGTSTVAEPTQSGHEQRVKVLASGLAGPLPQTSEQDASPLWRIAGVMGLLGLLHFRRKRKQ
ncbi:MULTISPECIES: MucBP domain-containing protein [Lactobacillaceae]|uniref:MucBP domain-containing protein n=1 Tax=Lactobacillaceae TaxID=33958 RepID=UPI0014571A24|nr:MucBP domain-containing protein [Lactobacillus sp. HBUAS51381]NLR08454.1 KxYKxGKxW signal peptide domain-containing protein [Lactobacillus sp. HBUAS51381]